MKMAPKDNTFNVTLSKEHLGQSVQGYLRAYGYFNNDQQFFHLTDIEQNKDGTLTLKGNMLDD